MRLAFSAPPLSGHFNPMSALALELSRRGHETMYLGIPEAEPAIREAGLAFVPYGAARFPPGELARRVAVLSRLTGDDAFAAAFDLLGESCRAAIDDGPAVLRSLRLDGLVLDTVQLGFDLVALHLGLPYVHVSNAVHFDASGQTPPCIYDWPYDPSPEGIARNLEGVRMYNESTASITAIERAYAEEVGLVLDWSDVNRSISKRAWISQTPAAFDFPARWPPQFHHAGPLHNPATRPSVDFPWDRLTGDAIVYASMGTLQNGLADVFRSILDGVEGPGRQVVLVIGGSLAPDQIAHGATTIVVPRAPQLALLARSSLCITAAGPNTALESLACGVPMVAIPVSHDHPGVGARIVYHEVGQVVPLAELTAERVRVAANDVLNDPRYRRNARRLQQTFAEANGLARAGDLVEQAFAEASTTAEARR